jgi:hypothetical protein
MTIPPNARELKAAATDSFVKGELARTRARDAAKIARLKALRLTRIGEEKPG